ncbi:PHF7 protein, partial [Casuarius casuarius]|nr:PHF7 protein [Casuarius casuarius]
CYVCGERGATTACRHRRCKRCFHFPCGYEDGCVSQLFGQYRSFCKEHSPKQAAPAHQEEATTTCVICLEPVDAQLSFCSMMCPTCQHAWFHRGCIQQECVSWAGRRAGPCWLCHLPGPGAHDLPFLICRKPAWEGGGAFSELYEHHSRCDALRCHYAGGREQAEEEGPWQLLLCSSCAAKGTHLRCSALR